MAKNRISDYKELCLVDDSDKVQSGKGCNVIPTPEKEPLWKGFLEKFKDPLIIVLLIVFLLSVCVSFYEVIHADAEYTTFIEPLGVLVALLLATGVGFWFEVRAAKEFDILNQVKNKRPVKVVRKIGDKTKIIEIPKHDVCIADIVKLENGDEIPADGILLYSENLMVDESVFTGEMYASKNWESTSDDNHAAYPANKLLRSSTVIEGNAFMQVEQIGVDTEEGKGVMLAHEDNNIKTPLNRQLDDLGKFISYASFVIAALIVLGRLLFYFLSLDSQGGFELISFFEMLLNSIMIAVALIVVAVPEGLPMSVTVSLALSMRKMLKQNNLVRKLHACETMGAATVICTDKTGTLTENRMKVIECYPEQKLDIDLLSRSIAVNSTATLSVNEQGQTSAIGNPTEGALLNWIAEKGYDYETIRENTGIVSTVPFSTEIKRMETITSDSERFVKGAPEIILDMCENMGMTDRDTLTEILTQYQARGMRTLAFAWSKDGGPLTFQAIIAISDPVRSDVPAAIDICRNKARVRVIMVTGDNALTAREIACQAGFVDKDEKVVNFDTYRQSPTGKIVLALTGGEFESLSDEEAIDIVKNPVFRILSRAKPDDKARLVGLLQRSGEVVAVTGDGTNDAPALKKAQVGLSMGDGTSRAKEASDITIIDNSFSSINTAILWGRSLYMNIRRFIIFQMTINVAACMIVLYGAFKGLESPLNVTQMLWVNLIMDTFAAMALSSLPADPRVMSAPPRKQNSRIIDGGMTKIIMGVGFVFFTLLVGMWQLLSHCECTSMSQLLGCLCTGNFSNVSHVHSHYEMGVFFTFFVMLQIWNIFNARYFRTGRTLLMDIAESFRTPKTFGRHFSTGFLFILVVIIVGQILIVNVFGRMFSVAPLSLQDWLLLAAITSPVLFVGDAIRLVRIKTKLS